MQRNEVIRIGYYYVKISVWSVFYGCYIGDVLYSYNYVSMSNGYYSLGIFTNYLNRNLFLKGLKSIYTFFEIIKKFIFLFF